MFNLANLITSFNLISGILAILFALSGHLFAAVMFVFAGAIFDFLDGFIARKSNTSGELGKQLDSLSDMVTFGVAPGVVMMIVLITSDLGFENVQLKGSSGLILFDWIDSFFQPDKTTSLLPLFGLLIPFFSLFRLGKFNIDTRQTTSFLGLPTPANTLFFMTYPLILSSDSESIGDLGFMFNPYIIILLIVLMGLLMISEIPLFSLKFSKFKMKGNEIRIAFLIGSFILILFFQIWAIALIIFLYVILSLMEHYLIAVRD